MNLQDFKSLFSFKKDLAGFVGVERERFICKKGKIVPLAPVVLKRLWREGCGKERFYYELSACQLEDRTHPRKESLEVVNELKRNDEVLFDCLIKMGLSGFNKKGGLFE